MEIIKKLPERRRPTGVNFPFLVRDIDRLETHGCTPDKIQALLDHVWDIRVEEGGGTIPPRVDTCITLQELRLLRLRQDFATISQRIGHLRLSLFFHPDTELHQQLDQFEARLVK